MSLRSDAGPKVKPPPKLLVIKTSDNTISGFDGKVLCQVATLQVDEDTTREQVLKLLNDFRKDSNAATAKAEAEWVRVYGYAHDEYVSWMGALQSGR